MASKKEKKGRTAAEYSRRGARREPYDYVLIVCEGKKTEPNYLQRLKTTNRLSSSNIKVLHPNKTDPMGIVTFAEKELSNQRNGYDRVFCVFDRDGHVCFDAAVEGVSASEAGRRERLCVVTSVPCFEVWLLLHFTFSTAPFTSTGTQSACEMVLRELRKKIPNYAKGNANTYDLLAGQLDHAISNAVKLEKQNKSNLASNPATGVHRLVEYPLKLKKQ